MQQQQQQRVAVHILADPAASSWLGLASPEEGAEGFTFQLDSYDPIDTQLYQKQHLANLEEDDEDLDRNAIHPPRPPPSTLGIIMFRNDAASAKFLQKKNLKSAIPKPRSLGLDSMLMFSDTLLPGVDHTAATCSSTGDLLAFINASGMEASPFQLIHSGVNVVELGLAAGQAVSNGSFSSSPIGGATGDDTSSKNDGTSTTTALPSVPPGRLCLLVVGDILSYCGKDILQMVAQMARPFRSVAPEVADEQLLAYCAQDACLVGGKVLVARDGCAVWRPQGENTAQGRRRAGSVVHSSQNEEVEKYMPDPQWDGGAAVFVNHPIGPAWFDSSSTGGKSSHNHHSTSSVIPNPIFRRVLRITWTDAFLGAEHGGPEARRRFSAPTVAVGIIHSSKVHQATKVSESGVLTGGHVFGNVKESVMWCTSPDAALFAGPHLQPVRGPALQCSPHVYIPPPKPTLVNPPNSSQQSSTNANNNSKPTSEVNPTVLSTTVTLLCDAQMNCVTIMNNKRRVVSWDLGEIWALKSKNTKKKNVATAEGDSESQEGTNTEDQESQQGNNNTEDGENNNNNNDKNFKSVFYPVVDIGFPGTIVEVIC